MTFVREDLLSAEPESVDRTGNTGEEAGIVKGCGAVVLAGFYFDPFGFELSEIGSETFVEGSVGG